MKKINITFITILIISILTINFTYWDSKTMSSSTWYTLYEERVSSFCKEYKINDGSSEIIYTIDKDDQFLNLDKLEWVTQNYKKSKSIDLAKEQYRKNMDNIYWCATNVVYYRALKQVKEDLLKSNPELDSKLKNKLEEQIKAIELKISQNSNKCKVTSEKNNSIIKKSVLKQTTYEVCKYSFYLEYLKSFNEQMAALDDNLQTSPNNSDEMNKKLLETQKLLEEQKSSNAKTIQTILQEESKKKNQIQKEMDDAFKVFPIAFKAYSEYENNITIHIYLELLREDYNLLREWLHKSINPINQVVYKISNAMKK